MAMDILISIYISISIDLGEEFGNVTCRWTFRARKFVFLPTLETFR